MSLAINQEEKIHTLDIEYMYKTKVWTWSVKKTNEEISRFNFKLHTFHRKVTDPRSVIFATSPIPDGFEVKAAESMKNLISDYHAKINDLIAYHNMKPRKQKNFLLTNPGDISPDSIGRTCKEFIMKLLVLDEYMVKIRNFLKSQEFKKDKKYKLYYQKLTKKSADAFSNRLSKGLEDLSKALKVVHQFIEFSAISKQDSNMKYKEGYVYKRTGGTKAINKQFFYICKYFKRLQKRWLFINKEGIGYANSMEDPSIQKMLYFQHNPIVLSEERDTGYADVIILRTKVEDLFFHTGSPSKKKEWEEAIITAYNIYHNNHKTRIDGFTFSERIGNKAKWYVDGEFYFADIYEDLLKAKHRIFISDWWFCPFLYLKRPKEEYPDSQIINVLRKLVKAQPKIKIYIHMYREPNPLDLGSAYSQELFESDEILKLNVHVLRHPERGIAGAKLLWAHHEKICVIDDKIAYLGGIDLCYGRYDTQEHKLFDNNKDSTYFPGPDFSNPRISEVIDMKRPNDEQLLKELYPRMPWHDIALRIEGSSVKDVSLHFMDLINWASRDSANFRRTNKGVVSQRIQLEDNTPSAPYESAEQGCDEERRTAAWDKNFERIEMPTDHRIELSYTCECQILRSVGEWSYGMLEKEQSICQTYVKLIEESKNFIYIENQFFISSTAGSDVKNGIAQALVNRILRANENNEKFKVIVCMPLLPAFEGEVTEKTAAVLKIQLYWEHMTISRSETSIFSQLIKKKCEPEKFINFYGLRTHGMLKGKTPSQDKPVTEIVYIHSKLMIVDDDVVIIGSANINDRSMEGDHDSEIACCIRDNSKVSSKLAYKTFEKSQFAFTLRQRIFNEFLANDSRSNPVDLSDPLSEAFLSAVQETASKNTKVYHDIFKCYPHDSFRSFAGLRKAVEINQDENVAQHIKQVYHNRHHEITGFIVEFPLNFLIDEDLKPSPYSKEGLAPTELWV